MKVGFSRLAITPPEGVPMGGHPGYKEVKGVRDELCVRAMAVEDGDGRVVVLSADILFLEAESLEAIRALVARAGAGDATVVACATHTHSGPLTTGLFGSGQGGGACLDLLHRRAAEAAIQALGSAREASLCYAQSMFEGYAFPARYVMADGRIQTHPWKGDKAMQEPQGSPDETVALLYAVDDGGKPLGGLLSYANHPQVLARDDDALSADFPGSMERYVCGVLGDDVVVLFLNGPSGDVCPVNARDIGCAEVGPGHMEQMGRALGEAAVQLFAGGARVGASPLGYAKGQVTLALRELPADKLAQAHVWRDAGRLDGETKPPPVSSYGTEPRESGLLSLEDYLHTDGWLGQEYRDLLVLEAMRAGCPTEMMGLSALRVGDVGIVLLPFEVFSGLGAVIKARSPFTHTLVVTLANGACGYLPTAEAFGYEGGYETLTLTSSRFEPGAGQTVADAAVEMLKKLHRE